MRPTSLALHKIRFLSSLIPISTTFVSAAFSPPTPTTTRRDCNARSGATSPAPAPPCRHRRPCPRRLPRPPDGTTMPMLLLLLRPHRRHPRPPDRTTLPAPVPLHLLHSPRRRAPERPSHDLPPRRPPGRRESLPQGGTTMASPVPLRLLRLLLRRHPRAPLTRPPPAPPPGLQTRGDPCRSRRSFPRISPRRKPPNSRSPRPRDRKLRKFRRSKPLRILSLIQPYLPHFAHVAEEKKLVLKLRVPHSQSVNKNRYGISR